MKTLGLLLMLLTAACGDDGNNTPKDSSTPTGDGDSGDGSMPQATFTSFVLDLVNNQNASSVDPVAFASFSALPDPDATNNNTAAYTSLFP